MFRRMLIAGGILPALMLAGCLGEGSPVGSAGSIPAPSTIADRTAADEIAMQDAELIYKLTRTVGEFLVDSGFAKGGNLVRLKVLDDRLYAALQVARAAFKAGNSQTLGDTLKNMRALSAEINALAGK